jgi:type IV secretion system pilin
MALLFLTPAIAAAAGLSASIVPADCNQNGGCQSICDLAQLAQNVLNDAIYLSVFLSAVLFAWAGWKHMTAGGDAHQISDANRVFSSVFIGLVVIISAWLLVDTLLRTLVGGSPSLPWNQICTS